jgi:two-component sensor histidine kinase
MNNTSSSMLKKKIKLLIIEDSERDVDLLVRSLKKNDFILEYDLVSNAGEVEALLTKNSYDLVISDFKLPGSDGIEVLKIIKGYDSMLPFIMFSGTISKDQETEILELGANEVIMKSNLNRLPFSVRRVLYHAEGKKKLERSLHQMEVLLKEVHHRVKNNLQVISSLLQLRQMDTDNEEVKSITADLLLKIRSIAIVHEKLYQSEDLANINLPELIEDLTTYTIDIVSNNNKQYSLACDVDPIQLNVNQAVPCVLIISELIHNSVQHAFSKQKECKISVSIKDEDDYVKVAVADNGIGLPEKFNLKEASGLGSTIVYTLLKQLKADYKIENDKGTAISFTFERKRKKGSQSSLI